MNQHLLAASLQMAELMAGAWRSRAIHAAAVLGVADALKESPMQLDELATCVGCNRPALLRLLRALISIGVFEERSEGVFGSNDLSRCLEKGALRDAYLMMHADWHEAAWNELPHAIRSGTSGFERAFGMNLFEWLQANPDAGDLFSRAMIAGRFYRDAGVPEALDLAGASLVVDVGGGYGSLLIAILNEYPKLNGILCDLPSVVGGARVQIENAQLQERCSVVGTDFFREVPSGGDVYLLAHILHDWSDEAARRILETCARAMRQDARVALVENVLPPRNVPGRTQWLDLEMLVLTPGGRERTVQDFRELASSSGLELIRITQTAGSRAIIELRRQHPTR